MDYSKLKEKVFWTEALVVDIPFFPFQSYNKTESQIVDYIANRVLQIARDVKRNRFSEGDYEKIKDRHFTRSQLIVGIDVSNITTNNISYLDHVFKIMRVYPCVWINCSIDEKELKMSHLHHFLKDAGYILPVFRSVPAADFVSMEQKYGSRLIDLLIGKCDRIRFSELKDINIKYDIKDLYNRIPGTFVVKKLLHHRPEVVWLGVESTNISSALTFLFNSNQEYFDYNKILSKFKISDEDFNRYVEKCMLFGRGKSSTQIQFRLLKKFIYTKLMHSLLHQFESKLIEAEAIDTTHGTYPGFPPGNIIEYHSIGKIFQVNDTYSCKLLCYIRNLLNTIDYDYLVLVDNGQEDSLYNLLPKIFRVEENKVVRIVNYFNEPILFPFDKIERDKKAVIITDVINTGLLTNKVFRFLKKNNNQISAVFTFIIDVNLAKKDLFKGVDNFSDINFFTFFEKRLSDVNVARAPDHNKRFKSHKQKLNKSLSIEVNEGTINRTINRESFLSFWYTIDSLAKVDRKYMSCDSTISLPAVYSYNIKATWSHEINLNADASNKITQYCQLYMYLSITLKNNSYTKIFINDNGNFQAWSNLIKKIDNEIEIYNVFSNISLFNDSDTDENILVLYTAMNIGRTYKETLEKISRLFKNQPRFECLTLFSRLNVIKDTQQISVPRQTTGVQRLI